MARTVVRRLPWKKALPTHEEQKSYEAGVLQASVRDQLRQIVSETGLSHKEIAERLEVTESRVSQILGGENYTLRFLAGLGVRFGYRWVFTLEKIDGRTRVEVAS